MNDLQTVEPRARRLGALISIVAAGLALVACDAEPDPAEPFGELSMAVLADDADAPASVPSPGPATVPAIGFSDDAKRPCAVDDDGDGALSIREYVKAAPMPIAACEAVGGASVGTLGPIVPPAPLTDVSPPEELAANGQTSAAIPPGTTISVPANVPIPGVVLEFVQQTGIPSRGYVTDSYDCDDFASDLEKAFEDVLPGAGTFTYIASDFDPATGNYKTAHAITDVHANGAVAWIEPQTGQPVNLDDDGDGMVTFALDFSGYPTATDGGTFIAVFSSADAAVAAGLTLD